MAEVTEETKPAVVSFHFGLPDEPLLARVRRTGAKIYSSATTVAEARWLVDRGADAIIAQGSEAGGHRGMFLTEDIGGPARPVCAPSPGRRRRSRSGDRRGRNRGRAGNSGSLHAGRGRRANRRHLSFDAAIGNFSHPSRGAPGGSGRLDSLNLSFYRAPGESDFESIHPRAWSDERARATISSRHRRRRSASRLPRKARIRRLFAAMGGTGCSANSGGGCRGAHSSPLERGEGCACDCTSDALSAERNARGCRTGTERGDSPDSDLMVRLQS
jgi:hypothetical protein